MDRHAPTEGARQSRHTMWASNVPAELTFVGNTAAGGRVVGLVARRVAFSFILLLVLALVGCDHATKAAAREALSSSGPVALVPGVLELSYTENYDSAFSLTRHLSPRFKTPLLALGSILGLAGVGVVGWRSRRRGSATEQIALALVVAGAIGNVVDRWRSGYVVDFIHLEHWPVFNVADVLIVVGVIVLFARRRLGPPTPDPL